jgi:hypothetical protein
VFAEVLMAAELAQQQLLLSQRVEAAAKWCKRAP